MEHISASAMLISLILLVITSGFFSGSEIGMMSLNRYRLRHQAKQKIRAALRVSELLARQDRLLGVILIGNTVANLLASSVVTLLASRWYGDLGVTVGLFLLTLVILIVAEIAPKTVAALFPERVAYIASIPLTVLLRVFSPLVTTANFLANGLLFCFGLRLSKKPSEHLSGDELRTVVHEASTLISSENKKMLVSILDLEKVTVDDIMIPRNEIIGINLLEPWDEIREQLQTSQHTRMPVYRGSLDDVIGFVHMRSVLHLSTDEKLSAEAIEEAAGEAHFIPEKTSLHTQLLNFKAAKCRSGLVVDEYGDIQGLVVLEDILEEIVGQFTTDMATLNKEIHPQTDGSVIVEGSALIRELNRTLQWQLPEEGPKTLSGLIIEYLEHIPTAHTCIRFAGYPIEVLQVKDNRVKTARVFPRLDTPAESAADVSLSGEGDKDV